MFDFLDDFQIKTVYVVCSVVGGAVLALQMLLLLFGGDVDVDADMDVDDLDHHGDGFGVISIRSIASFLTFFGLSGWWGTVEGWGPGRTVAVAMGAGGGMMLIVAWIMSLQSKLYSEGNLRPENAIGQAAKVYLKIPAENSGRGKITVSIQGRSQEYAAFTTGPELPTGSDVRVVEMSSENTFKVEALT